MGLRDLQSIEEMISRLQTATNICVVGNGGIALELIHELTFCNVEWIIKDDYVGSKFFDATASAFIMPTLHGRMQSLPLPHKHFAEQRLVHDICKSAGYALGSDWAAKSSFKRISASTAQVGSLKVRRRCLSQPYRRLVILHYIQGTFISRGSRFFRFTRQFLGVAI